MSQSYVKMAVDVLVDGPIMSQSYVKMAVDLLVDGPIMSQSYVKMAVDVHQSAMLVCSARGWQTPTMTWSRNSTLLTDSTKYRITSRDDADEQFPVVSVLNINDVEQDDLSVYSCTAHNEMGASVTHFNLTVRSKTLFSVSNIHLP